MLPNLIVIGAQKSGTSSLHNYLGLHPAISMSDPKELDFFCGPGWPNWDRGVEWYAARFPDDMPVRGESSPSYSAHPYVKGVPGRMSSIVPGVRLIYLVRDPVERMVSQYLHARFRGRETRPIAEVFSDDRFHGSGYVAQSSYHAQLRLYLEHFDRERILVVDQHDLLRRRRATLRRIFRFLGVDERFGSPQFAVMHNPSSDRARGAALRRRTRRAFRVAAGPAGERLDAAVARVGRGPAIDRGLRRELAAYFIEDVARLRELTGQPFASWSL